MSNWIRLSGTTALVTLMTGSAAVADVTAQQVWGDWKSYMEGFGYTMQASEATSGDTLTVSDLKMGMVLPEEEGHIEMTMGAVTFSNVGDGTVKVGMPITFPFSVNIRPKDEDPIAIDVIYTADGFDMIVSGDTSDMTYDYTAKSIAVALDKIMAEGKTVDIGKAEFVMTDVAGQSHMTIGNMRAADQSFKTGTVTYELDMADPEGGDGRIKMKGSVAGLDFAGKGLIPMVGVDTSDMNALLKAGFSFDGTFGYQGGQSEFAFTEGSDTMSGSSSTQSGSAVVAMSEGQLKYDVSAKGVALAMQGSDIPFPINIDMAESGFRLITPLAKSDEEQDFQLGVTLGDFSMSDEIWSLFDPSAQLPRDPATIAFDLTGKARLLFDMMDPKQMEAVERGDTMPGEVNAVTLNSLEVSVAGAALTGDGDFVIDNSDTTTFDGMPKPVGVANFKLVGANGLMDKLVAMGLLPEDQAMGARMMLSMFAVPAGDDALTSKLEVKEDGSVLANGQRLR